MTTAQALTSGAGAAIVFLIKFAAGTLAVGLGIVIGQDLPPRLALVLSLLASLFTPAKGERFQHGVFIFLCGFTLIGTAAHITASRAEGKRLQSS